MDGDTLFRAFADSMPNLAWIADPDGFLYWYNERWYEYTGTSPEEMRGWGWQTVHDPDRLPEVLTLWRASIASGEPFEMTFPLRGADGRFRPFLTRGSPLKDEAGAVLCWFGTNTEVTSAMETAEALRASEARFRTATQAVNSILWTNDANGKMAGAQPGWTAFTGQSQEEYSGYGWADAVHPEDAEATLMAWETAVEHRSLFAFEHRLRRSDGVYRLFSIRALPILNEAGEIREWVGTHTDITEERETRRKLQETVAELREQKEMVESAQLVTHVGFWRLQFEPTKLYLDFGSRRLLELPEDREIPLEEAFLKVHPEDRAAIQQALAEARVTGKYRVEFRTAATEEPRWILGVAHRTEGADGSEFLVGMNIDRTQQKRSDEALMRTEKLAVAGRLAASIAHEINNPLEAMVNVAYLLRESGLTEAQLRYMEVLEAELARVTQIATHTLRFHRQATRAGKMHARELIDSVLALYEGRLRNGDVTVSCRMRASQMFHGLNGEIRQVLANLVGNAIDAMVSQPAPRVLYVRTGDTKLPGSGEPAVRITVADRGTGMAPETLARIYEAFFTTKMETGTGLGLWVSHQIVAKHGGAMRVRSSVQPGRNGTVFQLLLPLDNVEAS